MEEKKDEFPSLPMLGCGVDGIFTRLELDGVCGTDTGSGVIMPIRFADSRRGDSNAAIVSFSPNLCFIDILNPEGDQPDTSLFTFSGPAAVLWSAASAG